VPIDLCLVRMRLWRIRFKSERHADERSQILGFFTTTIIWILSFALLFSSVTADRPTGWPHQPDFCVLQLDRTAVRIGTSIKERPDRGGDKERPIEVATRSARSRWRQGAPDPGGDKERPI
jgi:hypothetical protein